MIATNAFLIFNIIGITCSKYVSLLQEMDMENPLILTDEMKGKQFIEIMKILMKKNEVVCIQNDIQHFHSMEKFPILSLSKNMSEDLILQKNFNARYPIILHSTSGTTFTELQEPIYFVSGDEIYEKYKYKNLEVERTIASFDKELKWKEGIDKNLFTRRGNFQNVTLFAMTGNEMNFVIYPKDLKTKMKNKSSEVPNSYEVAFLQYTQYTISNYI